MATPSQSRAPSTSRWQTAAGLSVLMLVFIAAGWPFMKKLGIEVDEAMIANGIYEHGAPWYAWHLFGGEIPVMLLTYVGALKTWLYNPLFAIWPPGAVSLRLPMLAAGAGTVALFFLLLDRAVGRRAAWMGTALLATDPSFVVTESIDFGFVAMQHAFKLGALVLLVAFHRRPSTVKLAAAFFLFGIAMWDKAVFVWLLAAIAAAGLLVFRREVLGHLTARNAMIASAAFVTGALPFIVYNVERPLETFTQNARLAPDNPEIKLILLKRTLDGSGLFGVVTAPDEGPRPGAPHGLTQRAAFAISGLFHGPHGNWTLWAFVASLPAVPLVWRTPARRPVLFALLFLVFTWLEMFFTTGAGGAVHHVILLWPFHLLAIAAVWSTMAERVGRFAIPLVFAISGILCASNLLVVNEYYVAVVRNGTGVRWTDAFPPLTAWLYDSKSPMILTGDWGILETINLLSEGELPVTNASFALRSHDDPKYRGLLTRMLAVPGAIWVMHSAAAEQWLGARLNLTRLADSQGYSQELLQTVHDRNGRPIFDIIRFRRAG